MGRCPPPAPSCSDAVRAFLEQPHVATVATTDDDGQPRQAVVWYRLEPDGRILLNSRDAAPLVREPGARAAASRSRSSTPPDAYRWVGLTGVVEEVVDDVERARDDIVALAHRYRPGGPDGRRRSRRSGPSRG